MANYSVLKAAVQAVVKTNGNQEITGANMQSTLISIINSLGTGYQFMGVATPSTSPGTPDYNVFYIGGAGTYANFGTSVTVPVGSICVFKYNGSWTKEQIALFAGIDDVPTAGSNNLVKSGGVYYDISLLETKVTDIKYDFDSIVEEASRQETHYADYYPLTSGASVGSNGLPTSSDTYDLVTITPIRSCLLWTNWSGSLGYTAMGYNGTRYRSTESNLPSSSNPLSVQANTPVYFSCVPGSMDESVIVMEFPSYNMADGFSFNDSQKDEVRIVSSKPCRIQYIQGTFGTASEKLSIYIPCGDKFIRYDFTHNITANKMKDVWRIQYAYLVMENTEIPLTINGEWECAFLINGQNDATGGDLHGYEMIQGSLYVFVDGVLKTPSSLSSGESFKDLRIVESTFMYKQDTTKVAEHGREYKFNTDGMFLWQSLKFVTSLQLDNCYMMMLPAAKSLTDKYYTNIDFTVSNITTLPIYKDNVKTFSVFGNDFQANIIAEDYPEYPATLLIHDNGGGSYNKCYLIAAYNKTISANTIYESRVLYQVSAGASRQETHYADYYPLTSGASVGSNGLPTSSDTYDLVTITPGRSCLLWTNWSGSLGYTAMGYNGTRYRSTESNLPSSSNPLSVQANTPVYFSCVPGSMDESVIVIQYE